MEESLKDKNFLVKAVSFILPAALIISFGFFYWKYLREPSSVFNPSRMVLSREENLAYIPSLQGFGVFDSAKQKLSLVPGSFSADSEIIVGSDNRAYVSDRHKNRVFVYQDGKLITEISVGINPQYLFINNDIGRLFVYNKSSRDLSVVDLEEYKVLKTIVLSGDIFGGALDESNGKLYLVDSGNNKLVVIDGNDLEIEKRIDIGSNSFGTFPPAYDNINHRLYFVSQNDNKLWVVDTKNGNIANSVKAPLGVQVMTLNQQKNKLYMTSSDQHAVFVFDTGDLSVKKIPLSPLLYPQMALADEKNSRLYVYNRGRISEITVLNMDGKVLKSIPVGQFLSDFKFSYKTGTLYALSRADGFMMTLKSDGEPKFYNKKPKTFETKLNWPTNLQVGISSKRLYALSDFSNNYLTFSRDKLELAGSLPLGGGPYKVFFSGSPLNKTYILNAGINEIWRVDIAGDGKMSIGKKINVPKNIFLGAALAAFKKLYIATDDSIVVIDAEKEEIMRTIDTKGKPILAGVDEDNGKILASVNGDSIVIIDGKSDAVKSNVKTAKIYKTAFDKISRYLYILGDDKKTLSILSSDNGKIIKSKNLGDSYQEIASASWLKRIYLLDSNQNRLLVLNADTLEEVKTTNVGKSDDPKATAIHPDEKTNKIFLTHRYGQVTIIDGVSNEKVDAIKLSYGANPVSIKTDPENNRLYVANKWDSNIQVYDLKDYLLVAEINIKGETEWFR